MYIPDPGIGFFFSGSRVKKIPNPDPHQRIKVFFTLKKFLSSRKYDPGFSSRIRILIFYPSRIPDPEVIKAPDPGSGSATLWRTAILPSYKF
jgi:hypothetical protein